VGTAVGADALVVAAGAVVGASAGGAVVPQPRAKSKSSIKGMDITNPELLNLG
jgi:hypothetical protein